MQFKSTLLAAIMAKASAQIAPSGKGSLRLLNERSLENVFLEDGDIMSMSSMSLVTAASIEEDSYATTAKSPKSSKSMKRRDELEAFIGVPILTAEDYATYTVSSETIILFEGVNSLLPNRTEAAYKSIFLQLDATIDEAKLVCASLCEADSQCVGGGLNRRKETIGPAVDPQMVITCHLLDPAQGPAHPVPVPDDEIELEQLASFYKGDINPFAYEGCDVPIGENLTKAFNCDLRGPQDSVCSELVTDDFNTYIKPSLDSCVKTFGLEELINCLECLSVDQTFEGRCSEIANQICSTDEDRNPITAPCPYDSAIGNITLPVACGFAGACGDFCPTACLPKIQTTLLCRFGSTVDAKGNGGGCITKIEGMANHTCKN